MLDTKAAAAVRSAFDRADGIFREFENAAQEKVAGIKESVAESVRAKKPVEKAKTVLKEAARTVEDYLSHLGEEAKTK